MLIIIAKQKRRFDSGEIVKYIMAIHSYNLHGYESYISWIIQLYQKMHTMLKGNIQCDLNIQCDQ